MLTFVIGLLLAARSINVVHAECPAKWLENLQGVWQASYRSAADQEVATVFNISLCGALPAETGCTDAAICMRSLGGKDVTRIGRWRTDAEVEATANATSKWEYKIAYKADCAAHPDTDGQVMLEFWCGTTLGAPEVVFSDSVNCRHTIIWRTWAACHSSTVAQRRTYNEKPCYVLDRKGGLVDLSRLVHFNGATMVTLGTTNYFFDMCRRIRRDPHSASIPVACDKSALCSSPVADPMTGTVLAVNSSALMYDADNNAVYVDFSGAATETCPKGFSATIHLSCPAEEGTERGISMESSGKCGLQFGYITQHACPRSTHISESCVMEQGSKTYDLTPLASTGKTGYLVATGSSSDITFQINPCKAFTSDEGCESVTACQIDDNGKAHALGRTFDRQLHLVDGEFAMTLEHGARCSNHLHRITVIQFQCNRTVGLGRPNFVREDDCVYIFDWANNITCTDQDSLPATTPSGSSTNGEKAQENVDESDKNEPPPLCQTSRVVGKTRLTYNLSPLMNDKANWQVVTGKNERAYTYFINVCRAIVRTGRAANCSESAAACQVRSDSYSGHGGHGPPAFSAGRFVAAPTVEAGMVTLRYRHGTKCRHAGERETVVRFVCAPGVTTSSPVFEDELDNCTYAFQWHTAYACPETPQRSQGDSCSVTDAHSGYTFDVSNLGTLSALVKATNYSVASCGQSVKAVCKQQDGGLCASPTSSPDKATVKAATSSALQFKHGLLSGVYTQAEPSCLSKERRVTVQYLCPPRPDAFQREAKEKLPADGSIHVDPESVRIDDCNMIVHWYTGRVCVVSPEQCVVRDGAGQVQYDLSALSVAKVNESNWKAESSNGSELFLINVCRPLMAVHGCHPHSAVCSVRPAAASKRPTDARHHGGVVSPNLGLGTPSTTALSVLFSGEVQLVYTSRPASAGKTGGAAGCKTTINFHCKKSVPVGHPVFVEKIAGTCSYVFDWQTSKACKLTEETSDTPSPDISAGGDTPAQKPAAERSCSVADQSGYVFNMYALHNHTDDYAVANPKNDNVKLRLNICAALAKPCGDDKTAASCITKADGSEVSGGSANRTVRYFDGTLRLEYLNGAACSSGGARKGKTIIEFTCDRTTHISSPAITSSEDACEFIVSWPTSLACPEQSVPCRVDYGGSLYDLSPLHLAKGYWDAIVPANSDYRFMINVCGAVDDFKLPNASNCANGHTSVCQVGKPAHEGSTGVYSAGSSQSSPIALKDGLLELRLSNGDQCYHHHQRVRSTIIQFECDPLHTGAPEFQTESDCEYRFLWRTRYACAPRTKKGHDCTVTDPYFPEHRYDLNPLAKLGPQTFSYENKTTNDKYNFTLSVCNKLPDTMACGEGNDKAGACQLKNGKPLAAAGDANGGLTYADGNLELLYWHVPGAKERRCHGRFVRSTRVIFMCDRSQDDGAKGSGPTMREEMGDCQYVVEWYTPLACNPSFHEAPCTASSSDGQVFDLAPLALTRGAWQAINTLSERRYFLSVCGELNTGYAGKDRPCDFNAAVCGVDAKQNTSRSYGQVHKLSVEGHAVVARYSDGSDCTSPGETKAGHYSSLIRFSCRQGSKGTPNLVEESGCQSVFDWASEAACGTRSNVPKPPPMGAPPSGGDSAAQPTAAVPTTAPLVLPKCVVESTSTHAVFDLRPLTAKVYSLTDAAGMAYNLSICGVLPDGSCPGDANPPHASVCQQTKRNGGKEWVNAGSGGGKLSYESGMVRLVIPGGLPCHHNKQPRKTIVQFYCDRGDGKQDESKFHGKPVFDREEDCVYTVRWPTHLACEKELKCSITDKKSGEVFDLSPLSKFNGNWKATSKTSDGSFLINVCRPLTPLSSNKCDFSASSCWLNGGSYTSLGHINGGSLKQTNDGTVLLSYSGGAGSKESCPAGRTTNISFHCGKESPGPVLTSADGGCDYHFQWMTPLVCTKAQLKDEEQSSAVDAKKCTVSDAVSGDSFDLSRLYDGDRSHTVKGGTRTYYLNPCGEGIKDRDGCSNADVCSMAAGVAGAPAVADMTSRSISYQYRTNTLNLTYTGGKCSGDRKWATTILFVCSKSASYGEPMLLAEDDCRLLFHWPTKFACGSAASECFLKAPGQNTIDLTPLARHRGSWHVRASDGDRFWLNLCAPVHEHVDGCPVDAAVCWQKDGAGSRKAVSVGAASLRRLHTGPDHKVAVLEYFSHQLCQQDPSRTYQAKIVLSCDPEKRFSEPVFASSEDCVFRFNWQTLTACPVGTRAAIQQHSGQCGYQDAFKNFVDLSTELSSHRLYKTVEGTFHLQLCSSRATHCADGAAACHQSQSGGAVQTIASAGYKSRFWTSYADGALLEVKSSRPCAADTTRNHSVFVNFLCDSVKSLEFDHSSEHCHYVFTWKTPAVCTHLPTQTPLVETVPAGDGDGGLEEHGGDGAVDGSDQAASHPTKKKSGGVGAFGVVVLVTLGLVFVAIAAVIYRSDDRRVMANRIFCFWRGAPRSPVTRRSYRQLSLSEEQHELVEADNDMLAGGDDDEQLLAL